MKFAVFLLMAVWLLDLTNTLQNGVDKARKLDGVSFELKRSKRATDTSKAFFLYYEKLAIVKKHNELRRNQNATNTEIMYWDYTLEKVAQNYANKCIYKHNPNRKTEQDKYATVGENLFYTTDTLSTVDPYMNLWYGEISDYTYSDNSCATDKHCDRYTQLVWHSSNAVGCGVKFCATAEGTSDTNILIVVCNYGPAGNLHGQKPYTLGTPCSDCPTKKTTCNNGLCSAANCGGKSCQNGGKLDTDVCMCNCQRTGYVGDVCDIQNDGSTMKGNSRSPMNGRSSWLTRRMASTTPVANVGPRGSPYISGNSLVLALLLTVCVVFMR